MSAPNVVTSGRLSPERLAEIRQYVTNWNDQLNRGWLGQAAADLLAHIDALTRERGAEDGDITPEQVERACEVFWGGNWRLWIDQGIPLDNQRLIARRALTAARGEA